MNFWPSAKRLLRRLRPYRLRLIVVIALGVVSVTLAVIGPKVLGRATDIIFAGVSASSCRPAPTLDQVVARGAGRRQRQLADLLGDGARRARRRHRLRPARPGAAAGAGAVRRRQPAAWLQGYLLNGVVQRAVLRLRAEVEDKLNRLPLPYFDSQPRGELLSRVTNDIDNIAQTLQQTLSQLLTSLLTVVGVLVMMFVISPLLAVIALVAVPLSVLGHAADREAVAEAVHRRSGSTPARSTARSRRRSPATSWSRCSAGSARSRRRSAPRTSELFKASFGAQFVSGIIMPSMMFIGNLTLRRDRRRRRAAGRVGRDEPRRRAGVHPVLAAVHPAADPGGVDGEPAAVRRRVGRAGLRPARRRRSRRRIRTTPRRSRDPRGRVEFEHVSFRYKPDKPLIEDLSLVAEPGQTVAIVGPTGAGKTTLVNLIMRFYELDGGRITLDGVDITAHAPRRAARRDRHGAAGHLAVRRHDPRQHRATATRTRPRRRSSRRPRRRSSTGSCTACPTATTPSSTRRAATSAPARSS